MNYNYADELEFLLELIQYKNFQRYGSILYAKYDTLKAECSIGEMVWGWCKNPCFAKRLIADLEKRVPNCERFASLLSKSNKLVEKRYLNETFDYAMKQVCKKTADRTMLAYSTESTNNKDIDSLGHVQTHATDEDGELWHGLLVSSDPKEWDDVLDSITVTIYRTTEENGKEVLWSDSYSRASALQHTRNTKDVRMFVPFKHPMILLNLNISVECNVFYRDVHSCFPKQVFGIAANDFCNWLSSSTFETKVSKGVRAYIDMPNNIIRFCQ